MVKVRCAHCETEFDIKIKIPNTQIKADEFNVVSWEQKVKCPKCGRNIKIKPWYDVNDFYYGIDIEGGTIESKLPKPDFTP
ncbi:MAG: hypothetical protein ACTSQY_07720 [Candidatus Odinarchaeia archaeon]